VRVLRFGPGPLGSNVYALEDGGEVLVVDAGGGIVELAEWVRRGGLEVVGVVLTHGHFDHAAEAGLAEKLLGARPRLHPDDVLILRGSWRWAGLPGDPPEVSADLAEGVEVRVGSLSVEVMHLPGHTPGSVAFYCPGIAFTGDVLFRGAVGRTDLPLSDPEAMEASLRRLAELPPDTVVYPGHGPPTTIGRELLG